MAIDIFIHLHYLRQLLLKMPGVTEKLCFGTPAFYVNGKLFARMKEDGQTLVVNSVERDRWMQAKPDVYFITDHYLNYSSMLINLEKVEPAELEQLLTTAWYNRATKKLIKEYIPDIHIKKGNE